MARAGSWGIGPFRLPEFGLTERAAGFLSGNQTSDLSNSISRNYQTSAKTGEVQGDSTFQQTPQPSQPTQTFGDLLNKPAPTGNNGGGYLSQPPQTQQTGTNWSDIFRSQYPGWNEESALADWVAKGRPTSFNNGGNQNDMLSQQAQEQARLDLESALTEYDRYSAEAQAQRANLGTERTGALSSLETGYKRTQEEAGKAKTEAEQQTLSAKNKALTTAQDVQRKNRNVLRALGILSSSAAGEMLNRPMEEFGTQAADLEMNLVKRKDQVNDWLGQRLVDYNSQVKDINNKYTQLVDNIDRDLRFNDRQRITAVKAAQQAAQQAVTQLKTQAMAYQQAAQQYNAGILTQIAQIKLYQNPQADVSGILSSLITQSQPGYQPQQVGVAQSEEQRRRLSGLGA